MSQRKHFERFKSRGCIGLCNFLVPAIMIGKYFTILSFHFTDWPAVGNARPYGAEHVPIFMVEVEKGR